MTLLFLGTDNKYRYHNFTGNSWGFASLMKDQNNNEILGSLGPVAKSWPDESVVLPDYQYKTVAILPSSVGKIDLYIFDRYNGRWDRVDNASYNSTSEVTQAKPFLEFFTQRDDDGDPFSDNRGNFMVGWMHDDQSARFRVSTPVSTSATPTTANLSLLEAGDTYAGEFLPGTSLALYSDAVIDNVFGVGAVSVGPDAVFEFYPHADGAPDRVYTVNSDFRVMEDEICNRIGIFSGLSCGVINVLD